jgi:hypothetical protein
MHMLVSIKGEVGKRRGRGKKNSEPLQLVLIANHVAAKFSPWCRRTPSADSFVLLVFYCTR